MVCFEVLPLSSRWFPLKETDCTNTAGNVEKNSLDFNRETLRKCHFLCSTGPESVLSRTSINVFFAVFHQISSAISSAGKLEGLFEITEVVQELDTLKFQQFLAMFQRIT